jgi:hypothetical protein
MPDPLLTDEELEAELKKRLKGRGLTDEQKLDLMLDHEALMVARHAARMTAQRHYDAGKGRAPSKAWSAADAERYAKGVDGD